MDETSGFRERVEYLVSTIPKGRVMTYGQIAAICGNARAARIVGGIAHFGDPGAPWQRVVNKQGGLATGFPGGRIAQKLLLEEEGIEFTDNDQLELDKYLYNPETLQL